MAKKITVTIECKMKYRFYGMLALARAYVWMGMVSAEDAAEYLARTAVKYKVVK